MFQNLSQYDVWGFYHKCVDIAETVYLIYLNSVFVEITYLNKPALDNSIYCSYVHTIYTSSLIHKTQGIENV